MLDYSKNFVTAKTIQWLTQLAHHAQLDKKIEALFEGEYNNCTQGETAIHTFHRIKPSKPTKNHPYALTQLSVMQEKMTRISNQLREGKWHGFTDKAIQDIVYLGIGGSHLGPKLVYDTLKKNHPPTLSIHFLSDLDAERTRFLFKTLDPSTTLLIVASKSFTTTETMMQFKNFLNWLHHPNALSTNVLAITEKNKNAKRYHIPNENILTIPRGVGGRYSIWSAIGLPIAIAFGMHTFNDLLDGAEKMDQHFRDTHFSNNIPVILGLLGVWYTNCWNMNNHVVHPYDVRLRCLPDYLQQLHMESNGKSVNIRGQLINYHTQGIIFGGAGSSPQHTYHQALFQGTQKIPVDFILNFDIANEFPDYQEWLIASCLAQSHMLMVGKNKSEISAALKKQGYSDKKIQMLAPHLLISGGVPSNLFLLSELTAFSLGLLLAAYEHKIFVQSVIWETNPYDQPGIEAAKIITRKIYADLKKKGKTAYDGSTDHLLALYKKRK